MRATEPWRCARMRRGCGRRSRILDCSVEGPRGAKSWTSEAVDTAGEGGAESPPFPSPSRAISISCLIRACGRGRCSAYPRGTRPGASLDVSRSPSWPLLPHGAGGEAWCGMSARDAMRGAGWRVPEMRGVPGQCFSRAARWSTGVGNGGVCCWVGCLFRGAQCRSCAVSQGEPRWFRLSHPEQEMSGDEDAELGPPDWRGQREFARLGSPLG